MRLGKLSKELIEKAEKLGYRVYLQKGLPVDDGAVNQFHKWLKVGVDREGIKYPEVTLLATLAHEVGHIMVQRKERDTKKIRLFFGGCNKWVLIDELRASAWAIRYLRRKKYSRLKIAKSFLMKCYGTYKEVYNAELDKCKEGKKKERKEVPIYLK